jgi:hypothetical protein
MGKRHIIVPVKIDNAELYSKLKKLLSGEIFLCQAFEGKDLIKVAAYSHFVGLSGEELNLLFSPIGERGESLCKSLESGIKLSIQLPLLIEFDGTTITKAEKAGDLWKVVPYGEKPSLNIAIRKEYFNKMNIERIDPTTLKPASNEEIVSLHHRVHQLWGKGDTNKELLANAHQFLVEEMLRRKMSHNNTCDLDSIYESRAKVSKAILGLEPIIEDPYHVAITGSVARGDAAEFSDLDIIINRNINERDPKLEERILGQLSKTFSGYDPKKVSTEFIWKQTGPFDSFIPLYHMGLIPVTDTRIHDIEKRKPLTIDSKIVPTKTKGGYGNYSFYDAETAWEEWGKGVIHAGHNLDIQVKFDGFRTVARINNGKIILETEDAKTDLSKIKGMEVLVSELEKLPTNTILDGELILYVNNKQVPRKDMKSYLKNEPISSFVPKYFVFDMILYKGEDISQQPQATRLAKLDSIPEGDYLKIAQTYVAHDESQFKNFVRKVSSLPNSEGAMVKDATSPYNYITGKTTGIIKIKNFKEIIGRIVDKTKSEIGTFIYDIEVAENTPIGKTYATSIDANIGDLLEIRVAEIKYDSRNEKWTWDTPIVSSEKPSGTSLTTLHDLKTFSTMGRGSVVQKEEIVELDKFEEDGLDSLNICLEEIIQSPTEKDVLTALDESEIIEKDAEGHGGSRESFDVKSGDTGKFVLQLHSIGLDEEQAKLKKFPESGASIHYDIRMLIDDRDYLIGFTPVIGSLQNRRKLLDPQIGDKTLVAGFKVHQPLVWLTMGEPNPVVLEPGTPGASANTYGIMEAMDNGKVTIGTADNHYIELNFEGKNLKGRYILQYVPVGDGTRKWMLSHPEIQTMDSEKDKITKLFDKLDKSDRLRIVKAVDCPEYHYTLGIVLEPDTPDYDGTIFSADDIEKACHLFMLRELPVGDMHTQEMNPGEVALVENYIQRFTGMIGNELVKAGSWLHGHAIMSLSHWDKIKRGDTGGLSFGGYAKEV